MKKSQKGFAPIAILIIIVVALIGLYYAVTKSQNKNDKNLKTIIDLNSFATTTRYKSTVKPTGPNGTYTKEDAQKEAAHFGIASNSDKKFMSLAGTSTSNIWATPYSLSNILKLTCPAPYDSYVKIDPVHRFEMSVTTGDILIKSKCAGYGKELYDYAY